jgi:hypothetical protein
MSVIHCSTGCAMVARFPALQRQIGRDHASTLANSGDNGYRVSEMMMMTERATKVAVEVFDTLAPSLIHANTSRTVILANAKLESNVHKCSGTSPRGRH